MTDLHRIARARQAARSMLRDFGVEAPEHIQIEAMADAAGAEIVESPDTFSATARLVRVNDRAAIRVSASIATEGARRFSIAHELGHLVLGHEESLASLCTLTLPGGGADLENEANAFAAELLMPEALVRRRCEVSPVDLEIARGIARDFRVSLLAAARRFVELTSERCALAYARGGAVRWVARSATFAPDIAAGRRLDPDSIAHDVLRGKVDDRPQDVPASSWLDMSDDGGTEIVEHAAPIPEVGAVASLLWIPERRAAALRCFD
ncbi:MAG: ImmA/IrrE family metallo-endopeptidase [Myxococcales bacterium]|nr:ImmA/IrrE family metallo-endopeptidase [Myxococcales bacterium]